MINIGISLLAATALAVIMFLLKVHWALTLPMALIVAFTVFVILSRKVQASLESVMMQMQRDIQANKIDRAIESLLTARDSLKNRQIFVASQINSQIGMLYYIKKDHEAALPYLEKGFMRHYIARGMLAAVHYKRKEYDKMKEVMDSTLSTNKKESLVYGLYAWFLVQIKEQDKAVEILRKGLQKLPNDEKLVTNLNLLQNNKKMKMRVYGDMWVQFMLERPPRVQQAPPPHARFSKKAMFRG